VSPTETKSFPHINANAGIAVKRMKITEIPKMNRRFILYPFLSSAHLIHMLEICNFEKVKITNIIFSPDLIVYQPSMMKKLEC
jgi:hypothetical protein